jgi:hypothetical protein
MIVAICETLNNRYHDQDQAASSFMRLLMSPVESMIGLPHGLKAGGGMPRHRRSVKGQLKHTPGQMIITFLSRAKRDGGTAGHGRSVKAY